jgi:peptide chain release factor 1
VTVAVMEGARRDARHTEIPERDLKVRWFSGTGAGGQRRNKVMCSVELTHLPTGIARKAETRSRENSMKEAMASLQAAVGAISSAEASARANAERCAQIGLGMRADKRRTWRFRDDVVVDATTGLSASCSRAMRGGVDALWPEGERIRRLRR